MALKITDLFNKKFPKAKSVVVSGDIHGDFNELIFKLCEQYGMRDTLLIVAGDCGFGFEKSGYYDNLVRKNSKRMSAANNWIIFIRGNHDNPAYFDGSVFSHQRFLAVPDYSVIQACSHNILCVGGAISIDRQYRIDVCPKGKEVYWRNEAPTFDKEKMVLIHNCFRIDNVVTHTAPSFCELTSKLGLSNMGLYDKTLEEDVFAERKVMDDIYAELKANGHPLKNWFYGHFHQSWRSSFEGVLFKMLDIMELCELN